MKDMDASGWQRSGSSIVWSQSLLGPLIGKVIAVPLREAVMWPRAGFPDEPPGGQATVLIGGLQAVIETMTSSGSASEAYEWMRNNVLPLVRAVQRHWDRVGLVFGMEGPGKLFHLNEADDLVYFGKSKEREKNVRITLGLWNGAASGEGAYRLLDPTTKEVGGFHVRRVS